jgi:Ca2+-binding RTX toxin-like protein
VEQCCLDIAKVLINGSLRRVKKVSQILGTAGNDTITGAFISSGVTGGLPGTSNDTILAGAGSDSVNGGAGDDIISGGEGDDTLTGEAGNDSLLGDSGLDWVSYSFVTATTASVTVYGFWFSVR